MTSNEGALWPVARRPSSGSDGVGCDVVGLGEISLDQVCLVEDLASLAFVDKTPLLSVEPRPGGTIATTVLGCVRLGLRAGLIAATGSDESGRLARSELAASGVDLSGTREVPGASTRTAVILVDRQTGDRSVLFHRDPRLALRLAESPQGPEGRPGQAGLEREQILRARALLLDISDPEAALWAAGVARSAGIPVLLDADRAWPNAAALLSLVDFPVVSERLAEELGETGRVRDGLRALRARGARLAVATLGERGALALSDEGWIESAGFSVAAVDTTGAGDAFRAGFVWALLDGKSAAQVMEIANAAGALNCLAPGAQSGLPSADKVRDLVRDQPRGESKAMKNAKATSGRAMLVTLALLLLAGAAGYNYHRNWQAEQVEQGMRPFRAYADHDLRNLGAAYRAEVDSRSQSYEALAKRRTKGRATDMLGENIANFEKAQRAADQKRAAAGIMAENQARLREIESELSYRAYSAGGVAVHLKRLTTI